MSQNTVQLATVILVTVSFTIWMAVSSVSSFVSSCSSCVRPLVLMALVLGVIRYLRIKPLHESQISSEILSLFDIDEANPKKNTIFHKAGATHAPENTMEAVKKAIEFSMPAIEVDLSLSKDGVCVLFHGPKLETTTDGRGWPSDLTFQELQSLNASANDPNKSTYPITRIPTLEECIIECVKNNVVIFFDCKADSSRTAATLVDMYKKHPELYRLGIVCSFFVQTVYAVRKRDPNIVTCLIMRDNDLETLEDDLPRNKELWKRLVTPFLDRLLKWAQMNVIWYIVGNSFVSLYHGDIFPKLKTYWKKLGLRIVAYTVNCPFNRKHLLSLGIPVISDELTDENIFVSKKGM